MRLLGRKVAPAPHRAQAGLTLIEVVVAFAISGLAVGGIVGGYLFCAASAQKSALAQAANARAMERLEQTRAANWDLASNPAVDELVATNFPDEVVLLELTGSGAATTYATNLTQISQISTNPPLKRIRVDCIWAFRG